MYKARTGNTAIIDTVPESITKKNTGVLSINVHMLYSHTGTLEANACSVVQRPLTRNNVSPKENIFAVGKWFLLNIKHNSTDVQELMKKIIWQKINLFFLHPRFSLSSHTIDEQSHIKKQSSQRLEPWQSPGQFPKVQNEGARRELQLQ